VDDPQADTEALAAGPCRARSADGCATGCGALGELAVTIERTATIVAQARTGLTGLLIRVADDSHWMGRDS
jgi:hypothetical protein